MNDVEEKPDWKISGLPEKFANCSYQNFKTYNDSLAKKRDLCYEFAKGKTEKKSIVLSGKVGNGKTHLAIMILKNLPKIKNYANEIVHQPSYFITADEFFMTLTDLQFAKQSKLEMIKGYLSYSIICLDDLGVVNFTQAKQENLYTFINRAYIDDRRIILTTNFTMEDFERFDPRIPSRLNEMAHILIFTEEDYRLKQKKEKI